MRKNPCATTVAARARLGVQAQLWTATRSLHGLCAKWLMLNYRSGRLELLYDRGALPQRRDAHALHKLGSAFTRFFLFFLFICVRPGTPFKSFQITSLSHGVFGETSPLSFMLLPPRRFLPSAYTSAVIYLFFCFCGNVVDMCLAPLRAPLISSWLRTTLKDHAGFAKPLIVHSHHTDRRPPYFWPNGSTVCITEPFYSPSFTLGSMGAIVEDRHCDLPELEYRYLRGALGLPKPMDLHYPDLWTFNPNDI